ncbi:MAG: hypothetical protein WCF04_13715 [Candidatus Nanopelagicales bacterium]
MNTTVDLLAAPLPDGAVPTEIAAQLADSAAAQVWSGPIARGEPVPITDGRIVRAYVFCYALGAASCPGTAELLAEVESLRSRHGTQSDPTALRTALAQFGRQFGSVCVSASTADPPVPWLAHFLPSFFLLADAAAQAAAEELGGPVHLLEYVYHSPEQQYLRFSAGQRTVVIDAVDPARPVASGAVGSGAVARDAEPRPPGRDEAIRLAWAQTTNGGVGGASADARPAPIPSGPPTSRPAPRGLPQDQIVAAPTKVTMANWELIPWVDHTTHNWCVPSSWAMVLGFYDNYVPGKGTNLGYGRWIDHWYELTPGGPNLPNLVDDVLPGHDAQALNGYTWTEVKTPASVANQWCWQELTGEIDSGRPCFFSVPGHTTAAYGYRVDQSGQRFALVLDPPNPNVPTHPAEYSILECTAISAVTVHGGTDAENMILISPDGGQAVPVGTPQEIVWFVWGTSTKHTRISASSDGGNTWSVAAPSVPTKGAWNGYAWLAGPPGNRVRLKVEGLTAAGELIAADGSWTNINVSPTASRSWAQVWGATGAVLAGSVPGANQPVVYATSKSTGDLYRRDPVSGAWTLIGGPGRAFALDGHGHLYGVSPDGSAVFRWDGQPMAWTKIGGPAGSIFGGGGRLFATNPSTGDVYGYDNAPMSWTKVGGPGKGFAVDGTGRLYGISPTGGDVHRWDGKPMAWTKVGDQASALHAGGSALYAERGANRDLYLYRLAGAVWTKVGGPGKAFAVDGMGRAFGLSPAGEAVFRYEGSTANPHHWVKVGGPAAALAAAGDGQLFATNPSDAGLWAYA